MSKLDDVLDQLNKRLGNSVVQRASELVHSIEIQLDKEVHNGEKIPPKPPASKAPPTTSCSDFFHVKPVKQYQPIDFRKQQEPAYRIHYQTLRQIGQQNYQSTVAYGFPNPTRFYEQAKYIQTISDDFIIDDEKIEPYNQYYISYMDLSIRQFRCYVTLHPKFLQGDFSAIMANGWGYLALYLSELVCKAAKPKLSAQETFALLEQIRNYVYSLDFENAGEQSVVKSYFDGWLFDYTLVHQLKEEAARYDSKMRRICSDEQKILSAQKAYQIKDYGELMRVFDAYCPYHICSTAVCKKEPYQKIYPQLFGVVLEALEEQISSGKTMEERLFGRRYPRHFPLFEKLEIGVMGLDDFTLELPDSSLFRYQNGRMDKFTYIQMNTDWIASVLRCMDYYFRKEAGTVQLKTSGMASISQEQIIKNAVHAFCEQHHLTGYEKRLKAQAKKQKAPAKKVGQSDISPQPIQVSIDHSKLEGIRKDASELEERLLSVYETAEDEIVPIQPVPVIQPQIPSDMGKVMSLQVDNEWVELLQALTVAQIEYLRRLVFHLDAALYLAEQCKAVGELPQLFLEQINEAALEAVGDTIMETEGEIEIFEEYADALKAVFAQDKEN